MSVPKPTVPFREQLLQYQREAIIQKRAMIMDYANLLIEYYKYEMIKAARERYGSMNFTLLNHEIADRADLELDKSGTFPEDFYERIESYFKQPDMQIICKINRSEHKIKLIWKQK